MSISSILNIAKNALFAAQCSIQVTANNISNLNTAGYSRQVAVLEPQSSVKIGGAILGNGVYVSGVMRYTDKYIERQLSEKNTELEENRVYRKYSERIEALISEENSKLSEVVNDFFNLWHELSLNPYSVSSREAVRSSASRLCSVIKNLYNSLFNLQVELDEKLSFSIENVNRLLAEIADLNRRIFQGSSKTSGDNALMDKRQMLLRELSGEMDISYFENDFGMITVLTRNGTLLVDGGTSYKLERIDAGNKGFSRVAWKDQLNNLVDITSTIGGGRLKATIHLRDNVIESLLSELDELAKGLVQTVNALHAEGYNLYGRDGIPFFEEITQYFAKDIDLSSQVRSDVKNIAASEEVDGQSPLGGDIARRMANLLNEKIYHGGKATVVEFISSINNKIGQLAKDWTEKAEFSEATYLIMEKQRESVSGVSLDEEISNLIRYGYAYQAAARLFTIADELFKSLIDAVR